MANVHLHEKYNPMKKYIWSFRLLIMFAGCTAFAQTSCPPATGILFENERKIDTASYTKTGAEVKDQGYAFRNYFVHGNQPFKPGPDTFQMRPMVEQLYCPLTNRMQQNSACSNKRCITAVKVLHGFEGGKMKVLYRPVYYQLTRIALHPLKDSLHYQALDSMGTYEYNSRTNRFDELQLQRVTALTGAYFQTLKKKKNPVDLPATATPLRRGKDTEAVIFSFQEIIKYYHAVHRQMSAPYDYSKYLKIYHGATAKHAKKKSSIPGEEIRHTLFFTHTDFNRISFLEEKVLALTPDDSGANLGHLCPPRCSDPVYPSGE